MSETTTREAPIAQDERVPRLSMFDVVEQQLEASITQAQATIASCQSALVTVRLLRSQFALMQQRADERRKAEEQAAAAPTPPATFGARRRAAAAATLEGTES